MFKTILIIGATFLFTIGLFSGLFVWYYNYYENKVQSQIGLTIIPYTQDVILTAISSNPLKRIDYLIKYDKRQLRLVDTLLLMFPNTTYLPCKIEIAK